MWVLLLLGGVALAVWLGARGRGTGRAVPSVEDQRGHELVEALYRQGVKLGFRGAWQLQVRAEEARVKAFVRRRLLVMTMAAGMGALLAALPLLAALGWVVPGRLPHLSQWQWLLLALGAWSACVALGVVVMPRDYRRFAAPPGNVRADRQWADVQEYLLAQADASASLDAMKAYLAAYGEERFAAGLGQGQSQGSAGLQTRISSAANAAYVQGKADGAVEARAQVSRLSAEAYMRGVGDGERTALAKLEGRIRAEREAAYRSGYNVGVSEARAATKPSSGAEGSVARPRSRADALAILELTEPAEPEAVRRRFRELQAALHPDAMRGRKAPQAVIRYMEEQFKLVGEAYAILEKQF